MLQLAYHAPPRIGRDALYLLKAFRSTAIVPELKQLALDESRDDWERRFALYALSDTPGDIYFPEMERFATFVPTQAETDYSGKSIWFGSCVMIARAHPSNLSWLFTYIEREPEPIALYLRVLRDIHSLESYSHDDSLWAIVLERIRQVYDTNPYLLEMDTLRELCTFADPITLNWLERRHDLIVYLCQGNYAPTVSEQLRRWIGARRDEMNDIIDWWTKYQCRTLPYKPRVPRVFKTTSNNPLWLELNDWYEAALAGNKKAFYKLRKVAYHEQDNLPRRADAIRFIGKLKDHYDVRAPLFRAVCYGPEDPAQKDYAITSPVRWEAGKALCGIASPDVWETMVDAFFIRRDDTLPGMLCDWITHLTDQLSGVEEPYPVTGWWGDERPWLRDVDVAPAPVEATDSV
jgi:hypothetical protein